MSDPTTSQSAAPNPVPQDANPVLRESRRGIRARIPDAVANTLQQSEVLALTSEEMVVLVGDPNCLISAGNIMKQIPNDAAGMAFLASRMPQLVNRQTGNWDLRANVVPPNNQISHPELLAAFMCATRIANEQGIPLDQVPMSAIRREDLENNFNKLTGLQVAATCAISTPITPQMASLAPSIVR